jgi:succinoglycan biosynthesis transport protein ExoP
MTNDVTSSKDLSVPVQPPSGRVDLREMGRILNRGKWKIAGTVALACVLTGAVLVRWTPDYRATASIVFEAPPPGATRPDTSGATLDSPSLETEVGILQSDGLLGKVVDGLGLDTDLEFCRGPTDGLGWLVGQARALYFEWSETSDPAAGLCVDDADRRPAAIKALARALTVESQRGSRIIVVSVESIQREKARRIVDALVRFYLEDRLQARLDAALRAARSFGERSSELKRNIEEAERVAAEFRAEAGLTRGRDAGASSQSLTDVNSQLVQARSQRMDRESRLVALQQAQRNPATLGGVAEVLNNPLISALRGQESEVARRIADLGQRYGDNYPRLQQAQAERDQIRRSIAVEVAKIHSSLEGDAEAARSKEAQLQEQLSRLEQQAGQSSTKENRLRQLERDVETARLVYEDFLKQSGQLRDRLDSQRPAARVLSAAVASAAPVHPRYAFALTIAVLGGLALGLVWIGIAERLDGGFRSGEQIERLTGRPVVAMIPSLSRRALAKRSPVSFAVDHPMSAYAEALRAAHTAIVLGAAGKPPRVIMITSSVPGEGKSTFACSLASLLARSNRDKKVIVIDCDLRRSSVAAALGVSPTGGTIDEYLSGKKTLHQVIGRTKAGLYYILARPNTPDSADMIESGAMRGLVAALSGEFDLVFLDTPPVMAVSDARMAVRMADYIVFLVRWEATARELALNALKLLQKVDKNVGVVLSQVDVRRHARYGYGDYGHYYSKYHDYYKG